MTDSKIFGRIPQPLSHTIDILAPISKWLEGHCDVAGLPQEVVYAAQQGFAGDVMFPIYTWPDRAFDECTLVGVSVNSRPRQYTLVETEYGEASLAVLNTLSIRFASHQYR